MNRTRTFAGEEKKWAEFFKDPTFWWDNRLNKKQKGYPDFKHVSTGEALWLDNRSCPEWVSAKLTTLADPVAQKASTARFKHGTLVSSPNPDHPVSFGRLMDQLKQSANRKDLLSGKTLHESIMKTSHRSDVYVLTALIDMYVKCGELEEARKIFDSIEDRDTITYNAIILGCVLNGEHKLALDYFSAILNSPIQPDDRTLVAAITACSGLACTENKEFGLTVGMKIHAGLDSKRNDSPMDLYVANSLVDMYARYGKSHLSRVIFMQMPVKDTVSWNALIHGYVMNGEYENAISQFHEMEQQKTDTANARTYADVLIACGNVMATKLGKRIHRMVKVKDMVRTDVVLATCLVNFYGKCGDLTGAQRAFEDGNNVKDTALWNALVEAYTVQGRGVEAMEIFHSMREQGCHPDKVTFVCLLNACSHSGLVDKGKEIFHLMRTAYGVPPTREHYGCMIDMLGRGNQVEEALEVLRSMPWGADDVAWTSLLGACRKWGNLDVGRVAFEELVRRDGKTGTPYVIMASMYARTGKLEERKVVLERMKAAGGKRKAGRSWWSDGMGKVHSFVVGDRKHPQSKEIYNKVKELAGRMKVEEGYVADVMSLVENGLTTEEEKEEHLCGHSEKLAIACALVNSPPGETVRVVKNLRVCDDCHAATSIISKLERRGILCRDASRLHVFENGSCSCGGFW